MRKITLKILLTCLLLLSVTVIAQEKDNVSKKLFNQNISSANLESLERTGLIRCASTEYETYLQEKYLNRYTNKEFEDWLTLKIEEVKTQRSAGPTVIQTIPVIFHIFTDGTGAENLSQSAVQAQIDQLNIDFRNAAGSSYVVAADTEVEFCLAQQDPNGLQLDEIGINRVTTYGAGPFTITDFDNTYKVATQWDPTKYMNVWVGDLSNNILGYAQFPDNSGLSGINVNNGAVNTDGIVVLYSSVGSIANPNPNGGVYAAGRTLSHEVGHWLGLRHIWGDTTACTNDDFCADTPDTSKSNGGCPTVDNCPADGLGNDMVENYMDYTDDTCMNTITADQKTRILAVLANSPRRVELITSNVCQPGLIYDLDGSIKIKNLNLINCGNSITPDVEVINRGNNILISAIITYDVDGSGSTNYNWTGSLNYGESAIVNLPTLSFSSGSHVFNVSVSSPNGGTDLRNSNDSTSLNFAIDPSYGSTGQINLALTPDSYGSEITWEFRTSSNALLYSGGPYTNGNTTVINQAFNVVPNECYTFTIFDSQGDGICCGFGNGSYELTTDNGTVIASGGGYGASEVTNISTASTLGVSDYFVNNGVSLYPNPTSGIINIKLTRGNDLPDSYKIYNILGQLVAVREISNQLQLKIDVSSLSKGVYFVKVIKEGASTPIPFIKN